jgi:serine/threonine protein kinase
MPIVGIIPPTKIAGPLILTPYSSHGSLEDVLNQVRLNDPPLFWNDVTKLRMIVSLVSGLINLHNNGIVHRELKLRDLIVEDNSSIRICDYAKNILNEHRFTQATQVSDPSYMFPEIYEEKSTSSKFRDPKGDVCSFSLILYELLFGIGVFPSSMSAAVTMRRSMSSRAAHSPKILSEIHPVLGK